MRHAFTRSTRILSAAVSHPLICSTGIYIYLLNMSFFLR